MDHLLAIRTFQRIVETRSFTRAAAHLDMPRSTVSKLLRELETHLGVKLLQRTTRTVTLTPEGAEYYRKVCDIVAVLDDTEESMREMGSAARGRLRIDLHSSMACFVLLPVLGTFRQRYPHIQLALGVGDRPVNLIEEGVDCVIRAGELADSSLIAKTLYRDKLITCASPSYIAQFGMPLNQDDLEKNHRIVGYFSASTGEVWPLRFRKKGKDAQVVRFDIAANDSAAQVGMLVNGLGVGQTFASVAARFLESGELVPVLESITKATIPISIIYPPNKQLNARVRVFIDWITERFSQYK